MERTIKARNAELGASVSTVQGVDASLLGTAQPLAINEALPDAPSRRIRTIFRGQSKSKGLFTPDTQVKRVAAYCRVSTTLERQSTSLETQMAVFRQKITQRAGWKLVGIYADEGISGTSVKKRREFQRMLADCEAGKIDYIITKSISRFARNTLECLTCIRHLQSLGVQLLFEKENIDTGSNLSEMILTVLAAFAQEESRSISANLTWGIRKRFEAGKDRWIGRYGFCKDENGNMVIHSEEAAVVRQMFARYERGASLNEVVEWLNAAGIPSPRGKVWQLCVVRELLMNEVYMGDMVLQKFRTIDHLSHKSVRNDATEVPSYYITDHHPAIVSRETFERVQRIRALRSNYEGRIPQYPYGDTDIRCPLCSAPLVQRNTRGNYKIRLALGCFTKEGCGQFAIRKQVVSDALLRAYNGMETSQLVQLGDAPEVQRLLRLKKEYPTMETVEYYWLNELVERIELIKRETTDDSPAGCWEMNVHWRCSLSSSVMLSLGCRYNAPATLAALYYINEAKYRARKAEKASSASVKAAGTNKKAPRPTMDMEGEMR